MQTRKHPAGVTRRTLAAVPIGLGCLVAAGCATWSVDSVDADRRTVVVNAGPFFQPDSAELLRPDERALDVAAQGCSLVMDQYRIVLSRSSKAQDAESGAWWVTHVFRCEPVAPLADEPERPVDPYDELRKGRP